MEKDLVTYYRDRAKEYDRLYERTDRQVALSEAGAILEEIFAGKRVLEIACGTGYWTERIAETALSVHATDINDAMLEIAKHRPFPKANVSFQRTNLYEYNPSEKFDALFGGFIWSHIPLKKLNSFIAKVNSFVSPGGTAVFMDNRFVEGSSTPIAETDADGNTYQDRKLDDGTIHRIIKNFPGRDFLEKSVAGKADTVEVIEQNYYWILRYITSGE